MRGGSRLRAGRPGGRIKAECLPQVDIRRLVAEHRPAPTSGRASLKYSYSGRQVSKIIELAYTPCNFGGSRAWFRCPHCRRRSAKLYLVSGQWYCRKSLNLTYASKSLSPIDRIHRRIARLEAKLDEDGEKPKGMHWRTYDRIIEQYNAADSDMTSACARRWAGMFGISTAFQ